MGSLPLTKGNVMYNILKTAFYAGVELGRIDGLGPEDIHNAFQTWLKALPDDEIEGAAI